MTSIRETGYVYFFFHFSFALTKIYFLWLFPTFQIWLHFCVTYRDRSCFSLKLISDWPTLTKIRHWLRSERARIWIWFGAVSYHTSWNWGQNMNQGQKTLGSYCVEKESSCLYCLGVKRKFYCWHFDMNILHMLKVWTLFSLCARNSLKFLIVILDRNAVVCYKQRTLNLGPLLWSDITHCYLIKWISK